MKTFDPSYEPYIEAIWIAMSDESISVEDAILRSLRLSLGIGEDLNSQIIEAIRSLLAESYSFRLSYILASLPVVKAGDVNYAS